MIDPFPRVLDLRPGRSRLPGGARGGPPPELPAGRPLLAWLPTGDQVHLDSPGPAGLADDAPGIPWAMIDWWIPL